MTPATPTDMAELRCGALGGATSNTVTLTVQ